MTDEQRQLSALRNEVRSWLGANPPVSGDQQYGGRFCAMVADRLGPAIGDLRRDQVRSLASNVGWDARSAGVDAPRPDTVGWDDNPDLARFFGYLSGQMTRYDFRFESLLEVADYLLGYAPTDALVLAFSGLARAGLGWPDTVEDLRRALDAPDADRRSRHCCLHGYWLATHLDDQADLIIGLADSMISAGESDANVYFRRAYGHRRKGLELRSQDQLSLALNDMARAFELSGSGTEVNQDFVRERELIALARMFLVSLGHRG